MKIFLSAVSDQFRDCRALLANALTKAGAEVVVQETFTLSAGPSILSRPGDPS